MARSSPYITTEGFEQLRAELDGLWVRRREVVVHLSAAAEGDRSENAEYIYRKKQLREMDRRIRYLQKRLPQQVVDRPADAPAERGTLVTVDLIDDDYQEQTHRIVGADEFDPARSWISIDSPIAKALIGKAIDDTVEVQTPSGLVGLTVVEINTINLDDVALAIGLTSPTLILLQGLTRTAPDATMRYCAHLNIAD